ncbi:hypothetical protein Nepgr_027178 [Nepenthes gracilis]|uniref:Uncharacterized protein n=1 Tax=Nepenthes gracilis TaxID=150966 RepID=A0AAD3Y2P9_NEPGR|nr:hypothetical protein Nepgr_027178 [Nepenthes gracilis]
MVLDLCAVSVPLRLHSGWSPVTKGRRMNYLLGKLSMGGNEWPGGIILHPRKPGLANIDPLHWWIGCGIGFSSAIDLCSAVGYVECICFAIVEVFSLVVRDLCGPCSSLDKRLTLRLVVILPVRLPLLRGVDNTSCCSFALCLSAIFVLLFGWIQAALLSVFFMLRWECDGASLLLM